MEPTTAIEDLDSLMSSFNVLYNALLDQSHQVATQWDGLKAVGGQCDEYAAQLLGTLRPHLKKIASFANDVDTQISDMQN